MRVAYDRPVKGTNADHRRPHRSLGAAGAPVVAVGGRPNGPGPDESIAAIIERLLANFAALARAYADFVRAETRAALRDLVRSLVCIVLAAVIGVYAVGLVFLTVVLLLAPAMPPWLAALVTLAGALLVAGALVLVARRGFRLGHLGAVAAQVRSDIQWMRDEIRKNA